MQISSSAAAASLAWLQRTSTASASSCDNEQASPSTTATTSASAAGQGGTPLFTNGQLNLSAALSPATLSSLFQETSNGTVVEDSNGRPVTKGPLTSDAGVIAAHELQQQSGVHIQGSSTLDLTATDMPLVQAATGYNLNQTSDGFITLTDDEGNGASMSSMVQALNLASDISEGREDGSITGNVTASEFGAIASQIQDTPSAFCQAQLNSAYSWLAQEGGGQGTTTTGSALSATA